MVNMDSHPGPPGGISGYSEAGLGTADPDHWLSLFTELGGWTLHWEGPGAAQPLWPAGAPRPDHEWLLGAPDAGHGRVRLFRFPGGTPAPRAGAATWDTGGVFDLDLRVRDLHAWRDRLQARGWRGVSEPVDWPFGELQVREWLAEGPDGVILALVQRLQPPLEPGESAVPEAGFGPAFNSSQTVRDLARSLAFYDDLGFRTMVHHEAPLEGRGGEVLGLAREDAPRTPVGLVIVHPEARLEGSLELVSLPETPGRDLAPRCGPGTRGLNLLRFPVKDLGALAAHLEETGRLPGALSRVATWDLPPHGRVAGLSLVSPDGAWLECFEVLSDTAGPA